MSTTTRAKYAAALASGLSLAMVLPATGGAAEQGSRAEGRIVVAQAPDSKDKDSKQPPKGKQPPSGKDAPRGGPKEGGPKGAGPKGPGGPGGPGQGPKGPPKAERQQGERKQGAPRTQQEQQRPKGPPKVQAEPQPKPQAQPPRQPQAQPKPQPQPQIQMRQQAEPGPRPGPDQREKGPQPPRGETHRQQQGGPSRDGDRDRGGLPSRDQAGDRDRGAPQAPTHQQLQMQGRPGDRERDGDRDRGTDRHDRGPGPVDRDRADRERGPGDRGPGDRDRADHDRDRDRGPGGDRDRSDRDRSDRDRGGPDRGPDRSRADRGPGDPARRARFEETRRERRGSIDEIRSQRKERREEGGRIVIEEPGNRRIIRDGNRTIIRHDESERFRRRASNVDVSRRNGERVTTITRPDGTRIITIEDDNNRLLRRMRRGRDGRDVVLIDNTRHRHRHHGGPDGLSIFLNLAMPQIHVDRHRYIVDVDRASEDDLYDALMAPPLVEIERDYSLDEIRYNYPLRARMRSLNLNTINFEFGSWELDEEAFDELEEVARAIRRALDRNPDEIFLIEGHTDAVGSDEDNLTLSDRRAESVAIALSDDFDIPAENLTTQGYGEEYLLVETQEPERQNRRVMIRRITPLMSRAD